MNEGTADLTHEELEDACRDRGLLTIQSFDEKSVPDSAEAVLITDYSLSEPELRGWLSSWLNLQSEIVRDLEQGDDEAVLVPPVGANLLFRLVTKSLAFQPQPSPSETRPPSSA